MFFFLVRIEFNIQKILSMNSCKIQKIIDILIKKETNIEAQATARILIEILTARYNIYSPLVDNCQIANLNETSGCISAYIKGMDGCYSSINDANMTKQIGNIKSCIKTKSELTESVKDFVHDSKFIGGRAYAIMRDGETSSGGIKSVFEGMLSSSSSMDPTNYRK